MLAGKDSVDVHSLTDEQFRLYKALLKKHIDSGEALSPDDQNAWCLALDRERPLPRPARLLRMVPPEQWTGQEIAQHRGLFDSLRYSKLSPREKVEHHHEFPRDILLDYGKPGHFRRWWPKTYSAYHWTKNRLVLIWIAYMLILPLAALATNSDGLLALYIISLLPNMYLMAKYTPWYFAMFIPYWLLWAAVSAFVVDPLAGHPVESTAYFILSFLAWTLYSLLKGVWHIVRWEGERKRGENLHPACKHPILAAGTAVGMAAAAHFIGKKR